TGTKMVPVHVLTNRLELVAVLEVSLLAAAVTRRQPIDLPSDRLRNGTVHDDADVFAGLAASDIELIAVPQVDAAVERACLVLAEIRLLLTELRRALGPCFGQHEIELELYVLELVKCRQSA